MTSSPPVLANSQPGSPVFREIEKISSAIMKGNNTQGARARDLQIASHEDTMTLGIEVADPGLKKGVRDENQLEHPRRYKVLLHNDDYTTMEFVVHILMTVFGKNEKEATAVMLEVHFEGMAVCGVYTAEIAEAKVARVAQLARKNGFPLKCTMEEV